jgi:hypothetical protein
VKDLTDIPGSSTTANMALEIGILSDIQVADVMYNLKNLTFSWDFTPIDGQHYL